MRLARRTQYTHRLRFLRGHAHGPSLGNLERREEGERVSV